MDDMDSKGSTNEEKSLLPLECVDVEIEVEDEDLVINPVAPGISGTKTVEQSEINREVLKMAYKKCAVKSCANSSGCNENEDVYFFHFPRNDQRQTAWLSFCDDPKLKTLTKECLRRRRYICSLHFKRNDFKTEECKELLWRAVPTLKTAAFYERTGSFQDKSEITQKCQMYSPPPQKLLDSPTDSFDEGETCSNSVEVDELSKSSMDVGSSVPGFMTQATCSDVPNTLPTSKTQSLKLSNTQMGGHKQNAPTKKCLYVPVKQKGRALKRLKRNLATKKEQLIFSDLRNFDPSDFARKISISNKASRSSAVFLSQLRYSMKRPHGRRWTSEEKIIALSLYKKSPEAYRFMRCMFALPCKNTLNCLISKIPFGAGINEEVFAELTSTVNELEDCDKMCVLLFDEMAIQQRLSYNHHIDKIEGVEDFGIFGRTRNYANQVMVFMVCGLLKKWKQPVAYYFSSNGISSDMLVNLIKTVLTECKKAGLKVMATVCDVGANQRKAVKLLGSTKLNPHFHFEGDNIITLFDPCHLIKCLRNQLKLHDVVIKYPMAGEVTDGVASWTHCEDTYQKDKHAGAFRWLWKLTDSHMNPTGREKLSVKLAAQVLSHSMAASIYKDAGNGLIPEAIATACFVELIDQLFDSLNGSKSDSTKKLRGCITKNSSHWEFWESAEKVIDQLKFMSNEAGKFHRPPSQDCTLMTIEGMKRLWLALSRETRGVRCVSYFDPRNVNLDPLDNTFGAIRSNSGSYCKPNAEQFVGAFKTCIVNGFTYQEVAKYSNCEDDGASLLSNLETLLNCDTPKTGTTSRNVTSYKEATDESVDETQNSLPLDAPRDLSAVSDVSGYIAKKALFNNTCHLCKWSLLSNGRRRLTYPSKDFLEAVTHCTKLLERRLEDHFHKDGILCDLTRTMKQEVSFHWFKCSIHAHNLVLIEKILKNVCLIGIPWWCKRQNRINAEVIKQKEFSR